MGQSHHRPPRNSALGKPAKVPFYLQVFQKLPFISMPISSFEAVVNATTTAEIQASYRRAMARLGFRNIFYAARFMMAVPPTVLQEKVEIFSTMPPDFVKTLTVRDLIIPSPWASWSRKNTGSISTRELLACRSDRAGKDTAAQSVSLARDYGLLAARLVSLKDCVLRSHGAVVLNPHAGASHDDEDRVWTRHQREAMVLSSVMHMRMASIRRPTFLPRLTERQIQVLEWSSAGKTVAETAIILGISAATVEKHLRLARDALGARTTGQAILTAHLTQQLFA